MRFPQTPRSNISEDRKSYTDQEFAVILSKASELARTSDTADHPQGGHSLAEMKAIAAELGLDPVLIEQAARLMPVVSGGSRLERVLGGPLRHRLDVHFATKLTEARAAHLLSVVRAAVEQQGEGEASSSGMSWNSVGESSQLFVNAHTDGEGTRVLVTVDRRQALVLGAVPTMFGVVAVAVVGLVGGEAAGMSAAFGIPLVVGGVAGVLALARAAWASTTRSIRQKSNILIDTISRSLAETGGDPASPRETDGPNREP
ncbi:MAG: hypothetical protein V3U67_03120 [Gemmatimonadota bacterium]